MIALRLVGLLLTIILMTNYVILFSTTISPLLQNMSDYGAGNTMLAYILGLLLLTSAMFYQLILIIAITSEPKGD